MHELRAFIESQMEKNRWTQADIAAQSGLSKQHISKMLKDERDVLPQLPDRDTLVALGRGLRVPVSAVVLRAAKACGVPVDVTEIAVPAAGELTDSQLLAEVARRLEARDDSASSTEPDGADNVSGLRAVKSTDSLPNTPISTAARKRTNPYRSRKNPGPKDG